MLLLIEVGYKFSLFIGIELNDLGRKEPIREYA